MSLDAIRNVAIQIEMATEYFHLFGKLHGKDVAEQLDTFNAKAKYLAKTVHPDMVLPEHKVEAEKVFVPLMKLITSGRIAITEGTYNTPFAKQPEFEIVCPDRSYSFRNIPFKKGHISMLYRGYTKNSDRVQVLAKISRNPSCNPMLFQEADILKELFPQAISEYIPTVFDTTTVSVGGKQYAVVITSFQDGYYSLAEILSAYPNGFDPLNAAWIGRRVIAQALCAKILESIHSSIIPDHILIHPESHKPMHIGWGHSLRPSKGGVAILNKIIPIRREYYPPEVFRREELTRSADIFMVGKILVKIFGGDIQSNVIPNALPKPLRLCIQRCIEKHPRSRYQDPAELMDEFTSCVRDAWGKKFSTLKFPK